MNLLGKLLTGIAAVLAVSTISPAMATSFLGQVPVGYSDNFFQVSAGSAWLTININAPGTRDSTLCAYCNNSYNDNFTVKLFAPPLAVFVFDSVQPSSEIASSESLHSSTKSRL